MSWCFWRSFVWPKTAKQQFREDVLETARNIENGGYDLYHKVDDRFDLLARQNDLLLEHFGVKNRPYLHPRLEFRGGRCGPERIRRYDLWEQGWSTDASRSSQERLLPEAPQEPSEPPDLKKGLGINSRSEKTLVADVELPSG